MSEPVDEDLARAQRQAEDAPAHVRELLGWLAAEDSEDTEEGRV